MAAECRGSWKGNEGNLGAHAVYSLTSQVPVAVLKPFTFRLSPQSRLCNVQLACLRKVKGSYLCANSGWQRRANGGVRIRGMAERSGQAATGEETQEGGGAGWRGGGQRQP